MSERAQPILTGDIGILKVLSDVESDSQSLNVVGRLEIPDERQMSILKEAFGNGKFVNFIGRSGHSRLGIDGGICANGFEFTGDKILDLELWLRYLGKHYRKRVIQIFRDIISEKEKRIKVGRLFVQPEKHLSKGEVEDALRLKKICLKDGSYEILDDGTIELSLENFVKMIDSEYLQDPDIVRKILIGGKHEVKRIQYESIHGLPKNIQPQEFLVGGFKLSTLNYIALIERIIKIKNGSDKSNDSGVFHLPARILDLFRTTGSTIRETELYNSGNQSIKTDELRLRIKLYQPEEEMRVKISDFWQSAMDKNILGRIHKNGVDIADVTNIQDINIFKKLLSFLDKDDLIKDCNAKAHSIIFAPNRLGIVPEKGQNITGADDADKIKSAHDEDCKRQDMAILTTTEKVIDGADPNFVICTDNGKVDDEFLKEFCANLDLVGGEQHLGKVFLSHNFPDASMIEKLAELGVGVFIAKNVKEDDIYLNSHLYSTICGLVQKRGLKFLTSFKGKVFEFYKGFWVRIDKKNKFDKVSTFIAMFGTNKDDIAESFKGNVFEFIEAIKNSGLFGEEGEEIAIMHGKGPGLMDIADAAARVNGLTSVGVGIDARKTEQARNFEPTAMLDFESGSGTKRQEIMDQLSVIMVYNIGGFGTEEEIAMAKKAMKLLHCFIGPQIFVDPTDNEDHFWDFIGKQAKSIVDKDLGPKWVTKNFHFVKSYKQALEVVKRFVKSPTSYWKELGLKDEQIELSLMSGIKIFNSFGIKIPKFLQKEIEKRKITCDD